MKKATERKIVEEEESVGKGGNFNRERQLSCTET